MIGEIIAIGDELTTGRILNTTSAFAAQQLFAAGHTITAMHTIGDDPEQIGSFLCKSVKRADFVIITGGLGSTTDDLTNEAVIKALGLTGILHPEVVASVEKRLKNMSSQQKKAIEKLAWVPEQATILDKSYHMAGYILPFEGKPLFFLPGVPPQMEILLKNKVMPALQEWYPPEDTFLHQQVYKAFGMTESAINSMLAHLENHQGVKIGYYPVGCEVHISATVQAADKIQASDLFQETDQVIRDTLGLHIFGTGEQTLAEVTGNLLAEKRKFLCTAESCTGGLIGSMLTKVPGSSNWYAGGVIAYSNHLKEQLLGVDHALLRNYGAVSPETARAMAARPAAKLGCNMAVSVTGIAGPGGGSEEKPVGTVYIGLFHQKQVSVEKYLFSGNRNQVQEKTAYTALDTVRRALLAE
ncbi:CinA family nicotinamide mononucleotide deamidase-related protein [Desulfogranum japonicum]|uniref:CinA family nicotinamide mononucleotide deamidase-related protein n=1 Tax=Desulfogranum japonicum TaxID=231447 RepID=UPI0003F887D7|nr:CinA family nicotinamide mononucleotide deamidase-related protein [Desulfogranum japonicum]